MIKIINKSISIQSKPFIIAEMSGNHNQSLERALEILEAVYRAGASAIKLQTYTADTITLKSDAEYFSINDKNSLWHGKNLYSLYEEAHTPWEWHKPIFDKANELGIICFSSAFDETSVDFLEDLNVPAYKIASFENMHIPLIKKVAATGKPMIISTGMASISEVEEAVNTARESGCKQLILLKCTSNYPSDPYDSNVLTIPHLKKLFNCEVGFSDHTLGIGASLSAVAHGATVIERHVTLNRKEGGVDSAFSLEPDELKTLVIESERAWKSLGSVKYGPNDSEKESLKFRRSIFISKDVKKGEIFSESNIKIVRPNMGLHPRYLNLVLGKKSKADYSKGTPISFEMLI